MLIIHTHFYSNSKIPYSKAVSQYVEKSKAVQSNLLPSKNVLSFLHFKKAGYFIFMTLVGNTAQLPSSFINRENKMLRLTITLLHIMDKNTTMGTENQQPFKTDLTNIRTRLNFITFFDSNCSQ